MSDIPEKGDWTIDHSAGSPILTYEKCSVIQDEQAEYVLGLILADRARRSDPSLTAENGRLREEVRQLRADKSVCLAAIAFAEECDEPDTFLRCWMDGSADVDKEWGDWQEVCANLVLDGEAASQPIARAALGEA